MVVEKNVKEVETLGIGEVKTFGISGDQAVYGLLSKQVYNNPIEAVIREVYSNAIDASKNGKIKVQLPTQTNGYIFTVEDDGAGMDDNDLKVFTEYGNSTKRGSNDSIGGLGIGAKSPFGYTDQFTVETSKNGIKTTLFCFLDESARPCGTVTSKEPSNISGTKITVQFKAEDYYKFYEAAAKVFLFAKYFPELDSDSKTNFEERVCSLERYSSYREAAKGNILPQTGIMYGPLFVEMGGVYYVVNESIFSGTPFGILETATVCKKTILLHAGIGELDFQASRESLRETPKTKKRLLELITDFFKNEVQHFIFDVEHKDYYSAAKFKADYDTYYLEKILEKLDAGLKAQMTEVNAVLKEYYNSFTKYTFAYNSSYHTEKVTYKSLIEKVWNKGRSKFFMIIGTSDRAPNGLMETILRTGEFDTVMYSSYDDFEPSLFDKMMDIGEAKKAYKESNKVKKAREVTALQDKNLFWRPQNSWSNRKDRYTYNDLVARMNAGNDKVYVVDEESRPEYYTQRMMNRLGRIFYTNKRTLEKLDCSVFNNIEEDEKEYFNKIKESCEFYANRICGFNYRNLDKVDVQKLTNEKLRNDILALREFNDKKSKFKNLTRDEIEDYFTWKGKKKDIKTVDLDEKYKKLYENITREASAEVLTVVFNTLYA